MNSTPVARSAISRAQGRFGPLDILLFSAWCALASGELEVASRVIYRSLSSTDRLYLMTRHFVWLVPLVNLFVFLALGLLLATATKIWPRRAGWLSVRMIVTWAVLPAFLVAGRGIYPEAWLILAMGLAIFVTPSLERHPAGTRRWLILTLPLLVAAVAIQATLIFGGDRLKRWRENDRPLPPPGTPNVLLIVLDTVRADHLSLYGYGRPTTPNLERLAARSIRFDGARAAAPWTLASHATLFTGRWPHELGAKWMCPLEADDPTLAEYLSSLGYSTAGFVGNTFYCAYDSGLDRGFTNYEDYVLDKLSALRTVRLIDLSLKTFGQIGPALARFLLLGPSVSSQEMTLWQATHEDRKDAAVVNREFLGWLSQPRTPGRPFFAFLNYVDAHAPYVLPSGASYRFGSTPRSQGDFMFLLEGWFRADKRMLPRELQAMARDSYDNCLAYLDERLGELFDELLRRGVLDRTLVILTADHGEGLGEHELFDHGESLYRTEIRVPLLIRPPSGGNARKIVDESVSLRDIPATIVNLVGPGNHARFPGRSLARLWAANPPDFDDSRRDEPILSELASPNPGDPNQGRSPAYRGPLISLVEGDYVYIRNERTGAEELFNDRDDPRELMNRSGEEVMIPVMQRFRLTLDGVKARRP